MDFGHLGVRGHNVLVAVEAVNKAVRGHALDLLTVEKHASEVLLKKKGFAALRIAPIVSPTCDNCPQFFNSLFLCSVYPYTTTWSAWSSCSQSCGSGGSKKRVRYCVNPVAGSGLSTCSSTDPEVETAACPGDTCPSAASGTAGTWSEWSTCTTSFDGSSTFQVRNRDCPNGHCSDALQEEQTCTLTTGT